MGTKETAFFDVFFGTKRIFFQTKRAFLSWEHLVNSIERQSCVFEHHLSHTVKLRSVLVQTSTPQETQFFEDFGSKRNFFPIEMRFLLLQHLANPIVRLSCDFEHHGSLTVKFRSVIVQTTTQRKTRFFDVFFWLKLLIFAKKMSIFIIYLHLSQSNGHLSCEREPNQSCTAKLGRLFLE